MGTTSLILSCNVCKFTVKYVPPWLYFSAMNKSSKCRIFKIRLNGMAGDNAALYIETPASTCRRHHNLAVVVVLFENDSRPGGCRSGVAEPRVCCGGGGGGRQHGIAATRRDNGRGACGDDGGVQEVTGRRRNFDHTVAILDQRTPDLVDVL